VFGAVCGLIGAALRADGGLILAAGGRFALAGVAAGILTGVVYGWYHADPARPGAADFWEGARGQSFAGPEREAGRPACNGARHPSGNGVRR
jgi:hypothetical protein